MTNLSDLLDRIGLWCIHRENYCTRCENKGRFPTILKLDHTFERSSNCPGQFHSMFWSNLAKSLKDCIVQLCIKYVQNGSRDKWGLISNSLSLAHYAWALIKKNNGLSCYADTLTTCVWQHTDISDTFISKGKIWE